MTLDVVFDERSIGGRAWNTLEGRLQPSVLTMR
jgi:hypothetical protein